MYIHVCIYIYTSYLYIHIPRSLSVIHLSYHTHPCHNTIPNIIFFILDLLWMEEILHQLLDGFSYSYRGFNMCQPSMVAQDFATIHCITVLFF